MIYTGYQESESQIFDTFNTAITQFSNGEMKVKRYSKPVSFRKSGYEKSDQTKYDDDTRRGNIFSKTAPHNTEPVKDIRKDNLWRTRTNICNLVQENYSVFKSFITLTFAENVTSPDESYKAFRMWALQCKRAEPDFKYIAVPERQKRGAIHFHVLTSIPCDSDIIPKREKKKTYNKEKKKYYYLEYYDVKYWKKGYSLAFDIINGVDSQFRLEKYLVKYITKEVLDDEFFGRQKILRSKGLKRPEMFKYLMDESEHKRLINHLETQGYQEEKKAVHTRNEYCPDFEEYTFISPIKSIT